MVKRFMAPGPWITRDLKECVRASDYDALAAERDALRKDAERYRWLRDSAGNDIMEKLMAECSPPSGTTRGMAAYIADAAVLRARK